MPRHLSDETLVEAVALRNKYKTFSAAVRESGLTWATLENRLRRAAERGLDGSVPKALPLGQQIQGVSTLFQKGADGAWEESLQWVKTKQDKSLEKLTEALTETFDSYKGHAPLIAAPKDKDKELLSVYPIADQHIGLLAWGKETGEDYDLEIGAARLRKCASRLIAQSPPSTQAIILNLGDWIHNDDGRNVTPKGLNPLDVDGRYFKVLTAGVQLMMDTIELALQKHDQVLVRNLPGNHDPHASIALTVALGAFYSKNDRVKIDQSPSEFFFHRFGQTLIGSHHGHRAKASDLAMNMAVTQRKDWGDTKYHVLYTGHIHHETVKEVGDCRVESFQTLAAKDAWSAAKGFCSGQSLTSITHHVEEGEVGRHRVNV